MDRYILGRDALFEVPVTDSRQIGEIVGIGYPTVLLRPHDTLEAENGDLIRYVVRAAWQVELLSPRNGDSETTT